MDFDISIIEGKSAVAQPGDGCGVLPAALSLLLMIIS
jgi:hypothetical protein